MDLEKQPQQPPASAPRPPGVADPEGSLRASDADRDRIADILGDALAEGRIDPEEHAERIDAVYRAKTMGELEPIVRDLPAARPSRAPAAAPVYGPGEVEGAADTMVAVLSASTRKGRWRVGERTNAISVLGSIEIDLTEAIFAQRLTVINVTSILGNVEIRVPENVTLRGNGTGIFGNFEVVTLEGADPEAPVVVVNGYALFGNVEARPKRGKWVTNLQKQVQDKLRKHLGH
ncbi:DUF1707 SHOCT-like domain-containing protein [Streptomyces roseicoloratus]|uniref:DUF1707 SHOCT-like domain-containing protein n=1 Tax=Streptomyces roseicoloratus TaxID=2508722 RepID=UPI001009DB8E|nr:DUF1707 domain-containing protein [Streptomyces roseicoloratus]